MFVGFYLTLREKNFNIDIFQSPLTYVNIALYLLILPPVFLVMFTVLILKERRDKRLCLTTAQSVCLAGFFISCCYGILTWDWLAVQLSGNFDQAKNTMWKLVDMLNGFGWFAVVVMISLFFFGYFPLLSVKEKKPVGEYVRELSWKYGLSKDVADSMMDEAYKKQQDDFRKG